MINIQVLLTVLFFTITINAQNFQGRAVYENIAVDKEKYLQQLKDPSISPSKKKQLLQSISILENMFENSNVLIFSKTSSLYKKLENLELNAKKEIATPFSSIYYKDFNKLMYYEKKDLAGNIFLIHDSLPKYDWKLSNEVKKIGGYRCNRAYFNKSVIRSKRVLNKDGGFETIEMPEVVTAEAWYATEIPISNGPHRFGGLPGLILEITYNEGKSKLICVDIEISKGQKQKISFPKSKNAISEAEYQNKLDRIRSSLNN